MSGAVEISEARCRGVQPPGEASALSRKRQRQRRATECGERSERNDPPEYGRALLDNLDSEQASREGHKAG